MSVLNSQGYLLEGAKNFALKPHKSGQVFLMTDVVILEETIVVRLMT